MSFDATNQESGLRIEFGCFCKADLAAAHKHCAEAWFKIKGNKVKKQLESNKVEAVTRVLNDKFRNASFGSIISDIADLWSQLNGLSICAITAIPYSANRVAQKLAKYALDTSMDSFRMEDFPFCVKGLVESESLS
ncbi:hypothetical protein LWI29_000727 [Acer saccharum]|uniref:RING-CH-type domain-containing protein n=1 Tax=Acer saccharum TaxID=4024 RepID=A0AA39S7C3_ACESA|nr:hypothetical protein LWI29_000727 [Acer saccharum]